MQLGQEIGSKLRARRLQLGMTQEQLAYLSHTSASQVGRIERGQGNYTIKSLEAMLQALSISLIGLCEYSGRFYTPIPEIGNHRSDMKETAIPF